MRYGTTYENENGTMTMFHSEKLNTCIYVVEFDNQPYMNIFDNEHGNEAMQSLKDNDIACQSRATTLPNYFLSDDEEYLFGVFCACFEAAGGDIKVAVEAMDANFGENGELKFWNE